MTDRTDDGVQPTPPAPPGELTPLKRAFLAIEELQGRLAAAEQARHEPIAIVGIGCRLPGDANDPSALWALLRDGVDAIGEVPPDRWDIDAYYDPDPAAPGKMATRHGGFLRDVDRFDARFFGIAPREAAAMDPQQRLLLEVAWEALEHAGQAPAALSGTRTGVYVGITTGDYAQLTLDSQGIDGLGAYYASGIAHSIASGRLSYTLGLQGPSVSLDTACSSSLVAVHLAVQSLRTRESDLALAGGVNLMLGPEMSITLSKYQMMAPDGRCKFGDASADGYVRAEGCAVVVLKRLTDARAAGDRILAVIRGSAITQDGASSGLTAPNGPAQEAVIRAALADGGVAPSEVTYVEAHGTGTALGDPMELQALGAVYGAGRAADRPLIVGSLKTNVGHMEATAGVGGLVKLAVMMEHGAIPASLHFSRPSDHIAWDELPITVPVALQPWDAPDDRRLAGLSSFGFSGTNVHLVVEGPPVPAAEVALDQRPLHLLALSARSDAALTTLARRYADDLGRLDGPDLADVAATAGAGRNHFAHRLAAVAPDSAAAAALLAAFASGEPVPGLVAGTIERSDPPKVAFLFAGQGAQHPGMGRALYGTQPVFRAALDRCADILDARLERPLLDLMFAEPGSESARLLDQTGSTQPALVALEHALAELWRSWGVVPSAVLGHSVGEYSAAILAGVMSLEDGLLLVAERGRLMQRLPAGGAMAAIFAPAGEVDAAVASQRGDVTVAAHNGPSHVVVSGAAAAVDAIVEQFAATGVRTQRLNVSHAFHSPLLDPMLDELERAAGAVALRAPRVRLISNLTGDPIGADVTQPAYWRRHAREAVQFERGVQHLARLGCEVFIDIGPHPTSLGMAQAILAPGTGLWLPSLRKGRDDWQQLLDSVAHLYTRGAAIDWAGVQRPHSRRTLALPTYPFERERHWVASATGGRNRAPVSGHPLLGRRLRSALPQAQFEQELSTDRLDYVRDHRVFDTTILPATGFIELALAAGAELGYAAVLHNVEILTPLVIGEDEVVTVQTILTPDGQGATFEVLSQAPGSSSWQSHARGRVGGTIAPTGAADLDALRSGAGAGATATGEDHYARMSDHGLTFGPSLRGIEHVQYGDGEALATVTLHAEPGRYVMHPALLDAALQTPAWLTPDDEATYLPFSIEELSVAGAAPARVWAHATVRPSAPDAEVMTADVDLLDDDGVLVASVRGIRMKRAGRDALLGLGRARVGEWLHHLDWIPSAGSTAVELPAPAAVVAAASASPVRAADALRQHQRLYDELEALSGEHVVDTIRQLGAPLSPGAHFRADDLGVVASHRRLLDRLLDGLAADGVLHADGDGWVVVREPIATATADRWTALAAEHPGGQGEIRIARRCSEGLAGALRGETDPLQLLFPGGTTDDAEQMYRESPLARYYNSLAATAVAAAAAELPAGRPLRILEIGGGTGGTTTQILPLLAERDIEYTFTDISPLFVARARDTFGAHPGTTFATLDIENAPAAQGFAAHRYDVVVAANVLHATADLGRTFAHVADLLAPGGLLVLLEMTKPQRFIDVSFGLTPGWWRFTDHDVRPDYLLLDRPGWLRFLTDAGYGDAAAAPSLAAVNGVDLSLQTLVVARAPLAASITESPERGSWLVLADAGGVGDALADLLVADGGRVTVATAGAAFAQRDERRFELDPWQPEQVARLVAAAPPGGWDGVVHLWSLDPPAPTPERTQAGRTGSAVSVVQALLANGATPKLWLVTRGALGPLGAAPDATQAPLWGLGLVVALEHPELRCTRVDLDPAPGPDVAHDLLRELRVDDGEDQVLLRSGNRAVARLVPCPEAARPTVPAAPVQVEFASSGVLDEMRLRDVARRAPGPDEVEIRVHAAGLNFHDVMNALAMRDDQSPAGSECAGIVVAVGAGVTQVAVGDAVVAVAPGSFGTYATTHVELVAPKPRRLTFAEAATIPLAFLTAHQALHDKGRIAAGDVVLIHAAAGGVGLAAVQLVHRAGAVAMGTAGSAHKRAYVGSLGVASVMDSRSTAFADEVVKATGGRGVDIVVNSLTGDAIGRSLDVLAAGGRFVELGKREIWTEAQVAARAPGVSYSSVPLADDIEQRPASVGPVLRELVAAVDRGELDPLPVQAFALADVAAAFRYMAQARHIGKIVLVDPNAEAEGGTGDVLVRPGATYLVTGGLSGLGLLVAEWLAGQGATHLALLGRRPPSGDALDTLARLRAAGTEVLVLQADVSNRVEVMRSLAAIADQLPPLRGVIHSAGVLDDGALVRQDWSRFATVLAPKVDGATHLHELTEGLELDHFVLFSSAASLFGSRGQANHAAANSFLDALAASRRAHGQPGLSINWGGWSEVGSVVTHGITQRIAARGIATMTPTQGLEALGLLMAQGRAQVGVVPVDWPTFLGQFAPGTVPPWLAEVAHRERRLSAPAPSSLAVAVIRGELEAAPAGERQQLLLDFVSAQVARVLGAGSPRDISEQQPLNEMGLDSLMAVELRNLLGAGLGVEQPLPATLVFDHPTVVALAAYLERTVLAAPAPAPGDAAPPTAVEDDRDGSAVDDLLASIELMSDDDVAKMFGD